MGTLSTPVRIALACVVFAAFAALMVTAALSPHFFNAFDGYSEQLVKDSLIRFAQQGDGDLGGFMQAFQADVHIAAVREILGPGAERDAYPYISNYSGQYAVGRFLVATLGLDGMDAYRALRISAILGTAFTLGLIFWAVWRDAGWLAASASMVPFFVSFLFVVRASTAYWQIYLSLLPFAVVMLVYPMVREGGRFAALAVGIGVLICLKSLTGYEYLTSVTLACMVPVLFHEIRLHGYTGRGLRRFVLRSLALGLASVAGFVLAAWLHIEKMAGYFGTRDLAMDALRLISEYSMRESDSGIRGPAPSPNEFSYMLLETFVLRNFTVNLIWIAGLAVFAILCCAKTGGAVFRSRIGDYLRSPLSGATLLAFIASLSWSVIMAKHAVHHPHINWVQGYVCFHVFAAMSLAFLLGGDRRTQG